MDTKMSRLERAAAAALVEQVHEPEERRRLRAQLESACVTARDSNSAGFMTHLEVDESLEAAWGGSPKELRLGGVVAELPDMPGGAGFALWLVNGRLDAVEGFAYLDGFQREEDRWMSVDTFRISSQKHGAE